MIINETEAIDPDIEIINELDAQLLIGFPLCNISDWPQAGFPVGSNGS